ncbi:MAG TPA: nucleotidyltransferase family protein [Tepidisphaeraceae bacterium]|jgi:hypothetical protein|nr:nucleotidyltransferase family protein [Tepidisphaeraceae bacterium]
MDRSELQSRRDEILAIARRHGAYDLRIFGSVARGDQTDRSDVDLLVHFEPHRSLMDHGMLIEELRELLGIKVDVVDDEAMRIRFREQAMKEAIPL